MGAHKFDPRKMERLNDPRRLELLDLDEVVRRFRLPSDAVLADLGAGTGLYAGALLGRLPEATCYALDIEPQFLEWMRANRPEVAEGRLLPTLMSEAEIPLEAGHLDFLFMISLHHELDAAEALLADCRRVLGPGKGLLVADWDPARSVDGEGPPRDHLLDPGVARAQIEAAGFERVAFFEASPRYYCIEAWTPA